MNTRRALLLLLACARMMLLLGSLVFLSLAATAGNSFPDIIAEDAARFASLLRSPAPARRIEGLQGLGDLKHWPAEQPVLVLLDDPSPEVRRASVLALGRLGGAATVPRFIAVLESPSWELRQHVWLGLRAMTAQDFAADDGAAWNKWWTGSTLEQKEKALLSAARQAPEVASVPGTNSAPDAPVMGAAPGRRVRKRAAANSPAVHPQRRSALKSLSRLATPAAEGALIELLQTPPSPPLDADERAFVCEALERCGSARAIPALAAQRSDPAAWALGRIGGAGAERALLGFPPTLPVLLALDRLRSTNCAPLIPHLVGHMGQITYRGQPDDVMNDDLQPIQRVGVNLIRRSDWTDAFVECVLQELEDAMQPPIAHGPSPPHPPEWDGVLKRMRSELKPGFVREDGTTTSQPVVAMCYLLGNDKPRSSRREEAHSDSRNESQSLLTSAATGGDTAHIRRLIALLRHPAIVPRVYVALALGRMQATEALPELLTLIREGYAFSDSTALASGKHFDQSQTVRWRGFLCLALGRLGGDEARAALEQFATDPNQPRDIRYGAVVGLRFIGSPRSLPALERAARDDIIWLVRDEARQAAQRVEQNGTYPTR